MLGEFPNVILSICLINYFSEHFRTELNYGHATFLVRFSLLSVRSISYLGRAVGFFSPVMHYGNGFRGLSAFTGPNLINYLSVMYTFFCRWSRVFFPEQAFSSYRLRSVKSLLYPLHMVGLPSSANGCCRVHVFGDWFGWK